MFTPTWVQSSFFLIITIQLWDSSLLICGANSTKIAFLEDWKNEFVLLTKSTTFKQEMLATIMRSFSLSPPESCIVSTPLGTKPFMDLAGKSIF